MNGNTRATRWEPRQASAIIVPSLEHHVDQAFALVAAAAAPLVVAGEAAMLGAAAAAKAVRTWSNYRPPRWKLEKCPTAKAVSAQWALLRKGRNPLDALRFGALLLNVSQYVDCSPIYGRGKHIVARNPGLKGWLREHCREINYVTAMSYRKLAQTTCQAIGLPEFLPLDWVLPGTEAQDAARELNPEQKAGMKLKRRDFLRQIQTCREKLARLLEGAGNVNQLNAALDAATNGHRHRASIKITDAGSRPAAAQNLNRYIRTALETVLALPTDKSLAGQEALLPLLEELKRQVENRCA